MRCNLFIDTQRRGGLATDTELIAAFLRGLGHAVFVCDWRAEPYGAADLNVYLERFEPRRRASARFHVGILDPGFGREASDPVGALDVARSALTQIWTRSTAAHEWFMERGCDQARFTGFLSRDPYDADVPRVRRALHIAGESANKNTAAVLGAYAEASDAGVRLPPLTIVSPTSLGAMPDGVTEHHGWLSTRWLETLLNQHRFHLCPTATTGWGHTITEATACGGVVITTDAAPMHEHVLPTFGGLLAPVTTTITDEVVQHRVTPRQIIDALVRFDALTDAELDLLGTRARTWNRQRNRAFVLSTTALLQELAAA